MCDDNCPKISDKQGNINNFIEIKIEKKQEEYSQVSFLDITSKKVLLECPVLPSVLEDKNISARKYFFQIQENNSLYNYVVPKNNIKKLDHIHKYYY